MNHTDTGLYRCVGTNRIGEDVHTINLTVKGECCIGDCYNRVFSDGYSAQYYKL